MRAGGESQVSRCFGGARIGDDFVCSPEARAEISGADKKKERGGGKGGSRGDVARIVRPSISEGNLRFSVSDGRCRSLAPFHRPAVLNPLRLEFQEERPSYDDINTRERYTREGGARHISRDTIVGIPASTLPVHCLLKVPSSLRVFATSPPSLQSQSLN